MSAATESLIRRARPDVVVIGAKRAGTTTLHEMLDQVDEVSVTKIKETDFFCGDRSETQKGWNWYERMFDSGTRVRIDISPAYAKRDIDSGVASRIAAANPDAKILFIARDPVERAISQYAHSFYSGQRLPLPSELWNTPQGDHIVSTSKYAHCLEPFREHFGDRIEILDFQTLANSQDDFLRDVLELVGVARGHRPALTNVQNSSDDLARQPQWWGRLRESRFGESVRRHIPRSQALRLKRVLTGAWLQRPARDVPEFSDDDRQRLIEALADDTAMFRQIYGKEFSDWCL